jgi:major membrane immunogen (membrane-anchored lipoprotein)
MEMKTSKVQRIIGCLVLVGVLAFTACKKDWLDSYSDGEYRLEENLVMNQSLFLNVLVPKDPGIVFTISDLVREELELKVSVIGSDPNASFQFVWDGKIQETAPMGVQLFLIYDGKSEDFEADLAKTVTVKLGKIFQLRSNYKDYNIRVLNGSKAQTLTLHPDSTISGL